MPNLRFVLCLLFATPFFHATLTRAQPFVSESFEDPPGTTYSLTTAFDDGDFDYFDRYVVPDATNPARNDFQTGWSGSYGIQGQDHDDGGGAVEAVVRIAGIDIAGRSNIHVGAMLGALDGEPEFQNYEAEHGDGIEIFVIIDGGTPTLIGAFKPPSSGAGNLYEDTNLNGVGDGASLTVELAPFSFPVSSTGTVMDIEVEVRSTNSFEPWALDRVLVGEGDVFHIFSSGFESGNTTDW